MASPSSSRLSPPAIPTVLHSLNREKLFNSLREHLTSCARPLQGFVLLQGGKQQTQDSTNHIELFRQESYFAYLFGVIEPGFYGAIDIASGKSTLFAPRLPAAYAVSLGETDPLSYFEEKYKVTQVFHTVDIMQVLLDQYQGTGTPLLFLLHGLNTDSNEYTKPAEFQGIEKFQRDLNTLHPILTECCAVKSDLELAPIQFANDISSEAHVEQQAAIGMDEEIVVYLSGSIPEQTVWYRVVLETRGKKRDKEGNPIEEEKSDEEGYPKPVAVMRTNEFRRGGGWAVIGDDIYYAGGFTWHNSWTITIDKDLIKHNIHQNDSSCWETAASLTIPRAMSFLAPIGRKLAIVSGTTRPFCHLPVSYAGDWVNCGEIYDLDSQSLDYLHTSIHYFDPYQTFHVWATTVLDDPTQVVFYNLEKGTLLILDASNGSIIQNETTPDPCFALFVDDPLPQGLQWFEESIALLCRAAFNSRAVFHRRTFYWFTCELMLYGYDMDKRQWFRSECLTEIINPLPVHQITCPPLLLGLPNENFLVVLCPECEDLIMASLSVEKILDSTILHVKVNHIQRFRVHPFFSPCDGGIAISLKNTGGS